MGFFSRDEIQAVRAFYGRSGGAPTPLHQLGALASELGLGDIQVKDETNRFGLPAFKIVGARFAMARLLESRAGVTDLAAATAGNHGRAVARVAREHGLRARIYVPAGTTTDRIAALESEGAMVTVSDVPYDDTVRLMARDADVHGWTVVSDTAWPGYEEIPRWIMTGYTWIFEEASAQWPVDPDVLIVQAGVGSLAGAAAGWLDARYGGSRPKLIIAEPEGSACVAASLSAGSRVQLPSCAPTAMVGLRCAEVSSIAWPIIRDVADGAVAVSESLAMEALDRLDRPGGNDPRISAGPSGACGIAAAIALLRDSTQDGLRERLNLGRHTRIFTIVTEGR